MYMYIYVLENREICDEDIYLNNLLDKKHYKLCENKKEI